MQRRRNERGRPFANVLCKSREFISGTDVTSSQSSEELEDPPPGQRFRYWARRIWNISNDIATRLKDLLGTTSISHVSIGNRSLETSCSEIPSDVTSCTGTTRTIDGKNSKYNELEHVLDTEYYHAVPSSYYYVPGMYGVTENRGTYNVFGQNKIIPYVRDPNSSPYPVLVLPRICPSKRQQIFDSGIYQPRPGPVYRYHALGPLRYSEDWIRGRNYQTYCRNHHYSHAENGRTQNLTKHQIPEKPSPRNDIKSKDQRDKVNSNYYMAEHRNNEYAKTNVQSESFSSHTKMNDRNKEMSRSDTKHESNDFYLNPDNHCTKSNSLSIKMKKIVRSAQLSDIISQDPDSSNQSAEGISIDVSSSQSNILSAGSNNDNGSFKVNCKVLRSIDESQFKSETPEPKQINQPDTIPTLDQSVPNVDLKCQENNDVATYDLDMIEDASRKGNKIDETRLEPSLELESCGDSLEENPKARTIYTPNVEMCSNYLQIEATSLSVEREEDADKSSPKNAILIKDDTAVSCEQDQQSSKEEKSSGDATNLRSSFSERIRGIWQSNVTNIQNIPRENGSLKLNRDELTNKRTSYPETDHRTQPKEHFAEYSAALKLASILEKMIEAKQTTSTVADQNQTKESPEPPPRFNRRCSRSKVSHIGIQYSANDDSSSSSTISTSKKTRHRKLKKDRLPYASIDDLESKKPDQRVAISNGKLVDLSLEAPRPLQIFTEHSIVPISSIQIASAVRQTPYGFGDLSNQHAIIIDHPIVRDVRDKPILDNCTSENQTFSQSYLHSAGLRSKMLATLANAIPKANTSIENSKETREKNLSLPKSANSNCETPILRRTTSPMQQQEMRIDDPSILDQIDETLVTLCPAQSRRIAVREESVTMKVICSWLAKKFRPSKNNTNLPVEQSFRVRECDASKRKKFTLPKCARSRNALQRFVGRTFIAKVETPIPPVRSKRKNRLVPGENAKSRKTIRWDLEDPASPLTEQEANVTSNVPISDDRDSTSYLQIKDPTNDRTTSGSTSSRSLGQKTLSRWRNDNSIRESSKYRVDSAFGEGLMDESIERIANISTSSTCDPNIDSHRLISLINDSGVGGTVDYLQTNCNNNKLDHVNAAPTSRINDSVTKGSARYETIVNSYKKERDVTSQIIVRKNFAKPIDNERPIGKSCRKIECASEDSAKELESSHKIEATNIEPKSKEKVERSNSREKIGDADRKIKSLQKNRDLVKVPRERIKSKVAKRSFDKQNSSLRTIDKMHSLDIERLPSRKGPACKSIENNVNLFTTEFDLSVPVVNVGNLKRSSCAKAKIIGTNLKEDCHFEASKEESQDRSGDQNCQLESSLSHVNDRMFLTKRRKEQLVESGLIYAADTPNLKILFNLRSDLRDSLRKTAKFGTSAKRLCSAVIGTKEIRDKENSIESIGHRCKSSASLKHFGSRRCAWLSKINVGSNDNNEMSQGIVSSSSCSRTTSLQELSANDRFRKQLFLWRANAKAVGMESFRFGSMGGRKNAETSRSEWDDTKTLSVNAIDKGVLDPNFFSTKHVYSSYPKNGLLSRKMEMKKREMRNLTETLRPMNVLQRISEETLEGSVNVTDPLNIDPVSRNTDFREKKNRITIVESKELKMKRRSDGKELHSPNENIPSTTAHVYSNENGVEDKVTKKKELQRKIIMKRSKSRNVKSRIIDRKLNEDMDKGKRKNKSKQKCWIKRSNVVISKVPSIVINSNKKKEEKVVVVEKEKEEVKEGKEEKGTEKMNKLKEETIGVSSEFLKQRRFVIANLGKEKEQMSSRQCDDSTNVRLIDNNNNDDDNNNNDEILCLNNFNSDRASNNISFTTSQKCRTSDFEFIPATLANGYSKFTNLKPNTQGSFEILITVVDSKNTDGTVNQETDSNESKREKKQPECISQFLNFINKA